jgi:uncharacterized protein (DUF1501 family)
MKRRDFIKSSAAILPFAIGGFPIRAFGRNPVFDALVPLGACDDHVLVLIQLVGGNDGLNTVIPLDQYSAYQNARSNIAIPENQVLKLTNATGLHPQLSALQNLYSAGKLSVIQSVGYPTPNFSHFRSTDIWLSASDYDVEISTGWLGRYLEKEYPGFPVGYPNASMPDPLAIQVGTTISPALEAATANMGMAFTNPTSYYNIEKDTTGAPPATRPGNYTSYIRDVGDQIEKFATPVKNAATKATIKSSKWPAANQNTLADQMKIVAQLISGGLKSRVYMVTLAGFDTHSNQNTAGNGQQYSQPTLLGWLGQAIDCFMDELKLQAVDDRVVGMTFSEFGRRIMSNGSGGTDHGAAAPVFVFGKKINSGIFGANPAIPTSVNVDDNIPMLYDFRSVYASFLKDWFCADDTRIKDVLFKDFTGIPIIQGSTAAVKGSDAASAASILGTYPNPFASSANVSLRSEGEHIQVSLFDNLGKEVVTLLDRTLPEGEYKIPLDGHSLASGTYYLRMQSGAHVETRAVVLAK